MEQSFIMFLLWSCVKPGDEVITASFSFFATPEAISALGTIPIFVDIRDSDFNIAPEKIEAAITKSPKFKMLVFHGVYDYYNNDHPLITAPFYFKHGGHPPCKHLSST